MATRIRWPWSSCSSPSNRVCCASANSRRRPAGFPPISSTPACSAQFYAKRILASGIEFDMLFGPAYKGIPLAAAVAIELARLGRNLPYAYNRKEAKDHGEGGSLVGAPVRGRVLVVDDVMSAGTAVRESIAIIEAAGARPHAVAIALDRQEMATENGEDSPHSAVQYVRDQLGLQVCSIARLSDLLHYLQQHSGDAIGAHYPQVLAYRQRYGVE
jgi:orotate phosphoribosyltransferase